MACGAGYYNIAVTTTIIALVSLVGLKYLERFYQKDSYRKLIFVTTNDIDVSKIIDLIQSKEMRVVFFDFERDYETGTTTVELSLHLFHKGITDRLFQGVIRSLEEAKIPLKRIRWDRP